MAKGKEKSEALAVVAKGKAAGKGKKGSPDAALREKFQRLKTMAQANLAVKKNTEEKR